MKYLVVGLGNIGTEYLDTRHNIGFMILDALASASNVIFESSRYADKTSIKHKGRTIILIKPTTYVNLSGKAVRYWLQKENIPTENLLIITDDLSLPLGKIRIKAKGGDAGHNGLKSIAAVLGNTNYPRLRFGIGNEFSKGRQVDFVLGAFDNDEKKMIAPQVEKAIDAIKSFSTIGIERTMNYFNTK